VQTGPSSSDQAERERIRELIRGAQRQADAASRDRSAASGVAAAPADRSSTATEAWNDARAGPRIAGYRIVREIHRGGQGVVYEATQASTRRSVAIKVMREGPFAGAADRARFEREIHILARSTTAARRPAALTS
jgi:serine/threonine protein kinase